MKTRIALIHALAHSVAPINDAMERQWPDAVRMNLLDDSLSADLALSPGSLDAAMTGRFQALADYASSTGAQALLFTCSAFGPCIDAVARRYPQLPVLKPNEAMIQDAVRLGLPVGLVASFAPTLQSMPAEFPSGLLIGCELAHGALEALNVGDLPAHDAAVAAAALRLKAKGAGIVALAQFSMSRAGDEVARQTGLPVLTTPGSAIQELKRRLGVPG